MLPLPQYQPYEAFRQQLVSIQQQGASLSKSDLEAAIAALQAFFQAQILPLNDAPFDPATRHAVQSYQTEMHKQLQLLKIDLSFWRAARQIEKQTQRWHQILERISTLVRYVDTVLQL